MDKQKAKGAYKAEMRNEQAEIILRADSTTNEKGAGKNVKSRSHEYENIRSEKINGTVRRILDNVLTESEAVRAHMAEHRLGGANLVAPLHAFATDERMIIVRGGFAPPIQGFKIINYRNITKITLERGWLYCRIHFSLEGENSGKDEKEWLVGLDYKEAVEFVRFVNSKIGKHAREAEGETPKSLRPLIRKVL
jgi:hypothetical protein